MEVSGWLFFGMVGLALYLLPTLMAGMRRHPQYWKVYAINALAGWTVIGWVIALVIAGGRLPNSAPRPTA